MSPSADDLVADARRRIDRTRPEDLDEVAESGGLIVDIRPVGQRSIEGELPGALIIERNVLEWRLDPNGLHRLPDVTGFDQQVVVVCSEGYASSLAAASLRDLGLPPGQRPGRRLPGMGGVELLRPGGVPPSGSPP